MAVRITRSGVALTVGIIIVTALIIGAFFIVKNAGEQARREDAIKVAEQNLEEQSSDDVALNDPDENKDSEESTSTGQGATTNDGAESDTSAPSSAGNSSQQSATELPQTGPAEQGMSLMIIALLAFSAVSYIASRKQVS